MTSKNYKNAIIKLLKDQFSSLKIQVSAFIEQLFELKQVEAISNVRNLRKRYNEIELLCRNLNSR